VSAITIDNLLGSPIQLARWGTSGLAVLTLNQGNGSPGMLYLIQDTSFVSNAGTNISRLSTPQEFVKLRWNRICTVDIVKMVQARLRALR
jgi:hypothetical protein